MIADAITHIFIHEPCTRVYVLWQTSRVHVCMLSQMHVQSSWMHHVSGINSSRLLDVLQIKVICEMHKPTLCVCMCVYNMGLLRLLGSSFAEYRLFYRALLPKKPTILRSLLIVAAP